MFPSCKMQLLSTSHCANTATYHTAFTILSPIKMQLLSKSHFVQTQLLVILPLPFSPSINNIYIFIHNVAKDFLISLGKDNLPTTFGLDAPTRECQQIRLQGWSRVMSSSIETLVRRRVVRASNLSYGSMTTVLSIIWL